MSIHAPVSRKEAAKSPTAHSPATRSRVCALTSVKRTPNVPSDAVNETMRKARNPTPVTCATPAETQKYSGG
jgi:hypothetical protein